MSRVFAKYLLKDNYFISFLILSMQNPKFLSKVSDLSCRTIILANREC